MRPFLLFILFCLQINISLSQNRSDFFKTKPVINNDTPEWAQLMYSENPNVIEVENLYKAYYKSHPFEKNVHTQNHKHWILLVEPLLDDNGFINVPSKIEEDIKNK